MGENQHEHENVDHTGELLSMKCAEKNKLLLEKHKPDDSKHDLDLDETLRQQAEEKENCGEKNDKGPF